jgi:hypothetical protein
VAQGIRSRSLTVLLLTAAAGCGGEPPAAPPPAPRAVDTSRIADDELVAAVLDECHRPLRGRMDRIAAEVQIGDGSVWRAYAKLPAALRAAGPPGQFLLRDGEVHRLGDASPDGAVEPATDVPSMLRSLQTLLDAASLGPLYRATGCRRTGPATFELAQPHGEPWTLQLQAGTLLPERLRSGDREVQVLGHLRTTTTWIVDRAETAGLGTCKITFEFADLAWSDDFFEPPPTRQRQPRVERPRIPFVPGGAEPKSPTPILVDARAVEWIVLDDPGSWPARASAYRPVHEELLRQEQAIAGFPILSRDGDRALLAVPFRPRGPAQLLQAPTGWQRRAVPAGRLLVVYPPEGDFAARCATGERLLREAAAAQSLQVRGPAVFQPFLHLQEGEPSAERLAAPVVRVSLPVE